MTVSNNVHYDYKLNNLNQLVQKSYSSNDKEGTLYTYDGRGNLVKEEYGKLNGNGNSKRTTVAEYTYDETNKMVKGVNSIGESSSYLFNGKDALVEQTWHIAKNGYGYHDVDAGVSDPADTSSNSNKGGNGSGGKGKGNGNGQGNGNGKGDKPTGTTVGSFSTVVKQFVIDYTRETQDPLMEHEVNGLDYRYVYGNERLSVNVSPITNGSGHIVESGTAGQQIRLYYHQDLRGTVDYLTSPVSQKVESWTHYNEWGEITHNAVLKCGQRELDLVKNYTGHDFDAVLNMYYAKARMYDAENRRFVALDPIMDGSVYDISERVTDPMMFAQYLYVKDNPLRWVDPLGREAKWFLGDTPLNNTVVIHNNTYAPIKELVKAYGGSFSQVGNSNSYLATVTAKNGKTISLRLANDYGWLKFTSRNRSKPDLVYRSDNPNVDKTVPANHIMEMIDGTNYMDVGYFRTLMCTHGYTLKAKVVVSNDISSLEDAYALMDKYLDGAITDGKQVQQAVEYAAKYGPQKTVSEFVTGQFANHSNAGVFDTEILAWVNYWNSKVANDPQTYSQGITVRAEIIKAMMASESSYGVGNQYKNSTRDIMQALVPGDYNLWIAANKNPLEEGRYHLNEGQKMVWVIGAYRDDASLPGSFNQGHIKEVYGRKEGFGVLNDVVFANANQEYVVDYTKVTKRMSIALSTGFLAHLMNKHKSEYDGVSHYGPNEAYAKNINTHLSNMNSKELAR